MSLSREDEMLMERLVLGEVDPDAPEVRDALAANEELREAVSEWRRAQSELDAAWREDARLVDEARAAIRPDDREALHAFVDARTPSRRGVSRRALWAAAAAILALALVVRFVPRAEDTGLLGSELCVEPVGPVAAFTRFVVNVAPGSWGRVEIVVFDSDGKVLLRNERVDGGTWELDEDERAQLAGEDQIRWTYDVFDAQGDSTSSGSCSARRLR